jgi:putative flippase GtrA
VPIYFRGVKCSRAGLRAAPLKNQEKVSEFPKVSPSVIGRKLQCHTSSFLGSEWPDSMKPSWEVRLPGMFHRERIVQFIKFCTVGGGVTVLDLATVWVASPFLPALMAVSLGYIVGVTCHFLLNKFWVFRCRSQRYGRQLAVYLSQVALCLLVTVLIVSFIMACTAFSLVFARLIAIPPTTLIAFFFMRFIVFYPANRTGLADLRSFRGPRVEASIFQNEPDVEPKG